MKKLLFNVTIVTLFALPKMLWAQAPVLGVAAKFVFYTTVGAVGNTQWSQVTGDVGTDAGDFSGFGNVNGVMQNNNATTIQAALDVAGLYSNLNGRNATSPHGLSLGGETLLPGVYEIPDAATLSGNLILNAAGDPNAVFIFKINGTFAANGLSQVSLSNSALACNVFWKVDGVISLLTDSKMKGTLVNKAAINLSPGVNLEGRALTTGGAVNISQVTAYTPTGCGSPVLTGPMAPPLGTIVNFGLFTGTGDVANANLTRIRGDVGSNSAAPTGFNADYVSGIIHPGPNAITSQAVNDLLIVYNYLNGLTADIELLYPADFGHELTLTPHTYHMASAPQLTGNLYLNAEGNENAVFVILINGALSTGTGAKVILTNGAQAKNVYWKVDGAVSIAPNSEFVGTLVVNNAAILLGTNVRLAGRALTNIGAVSTDAVTTLMNADGTLPLTWVAFNGKASGENVILEWSTVNEVNNKSFTILKSADGRNFVQLTTVDAHSELKGAKLQYSFTDDRPFSNGYYSISQTDKDGVKSYYKTIQVKIDVNSNFKAYHYSQQNHLYVTASGAAARKATLKLYDLNGRLINSRSVMLSKEATTYKFDKLPVQGAYVVTIESEGNVLYKKQVMVF